MTNRMRGFSLVEVMCAVTMYTIGALAILLSLSVSFNAHKISEEYTEANFYAQQLLSLLRTNILNPFGETEGNFSGTPYYWTATFTYSGIENLYEVNLKISWQRRGQSRSLSMVTYQFFEGT